eukprot:CAMPEP_0201593678 /NCGR_PEP_ID=MMETSP0190_2-20130828/191215_1 /ASSEMBLY_ACC=CAM_ASM_000263 /TAXON_ID=37353 /ORGANISM="Rosalina sp." /LENGTH=396 /DNA_ID=CAMNT_0048052969 /DNA_START=803 /DNA_END=1993 /DNA_ORIENTATION=-
MGVHHYKANVGGTSSNDRRHIRSSSMSNIEKKVNRQDTDLTNVRLQNISNVKDLQELEASISRTYNWDQLPSSANEDSMDESNRDETPNELTHTYSGNTPTPVPHPSQLSFGNRHELIPITNSRSNTPIPINRKHSGSMSMSLSVKKPKLKIDSKSERIKSHKSNKSLYRHGSDTPWGIDEIQDLHREMSQQLMNLAHIQEITDNKPPVPNQPQVPPPIHPHPQPPPSFNQHHRAQSVPFSMALDYHMIMEPSEIEYTLSYDLDLAKRRIKTSGFRRHTDDMDNDTPTSQTSLFRIDSAENWKPEDIEKERDEMQKQMFHLAKSQIQVLNENEKEEGDHNDESKSITLNDESASGTFVEVMTPIDVDLDSPTTLKEDDNDEENEGPEEDGYVKDED